MIPDSLPFFIFGLLMLVSHVAGAAMANWSFRDAARFQGSLLADRDRLNTENVAQSEQIFALRGEILELKQQLDGALAQITQLSAQLTIE